MKVNTSNNSTINFEWLKDLRRNNPWIAVLVPFYLIAVFIVLLNPNSLSLNNIDAKYTQLGLSFIAFILLVMVGISSYRHGFQQSWSAIFIVYSINFLGLSLEALNLSIADMNAPLLFLLWRFPMVLYIAGLWINLANFFTDKSYLKYIPAIAIIVFTEIWFIVSLTILENIILAMNGFLYGVFIPITLLSAFIWYKFSKETNYTASSLIALGFLLIGLVYSQWTLWDPTSLNPLYSIFFTIFNLSLILLLRGFNSISLKNRV
jgi:hypothetical protein